MVEPIERDQVRRAVEDAFDGVDMPDIPLHNPDHIVGDSCDSSGLTLNLSCGIKLKFNAEHIEPLHMMLAEWLEEYGSG